MIRGGRFPPKTTPPLLLEVMVEKEENVFPMVPSGAGVAEIRLE